MLHDPACLKCNSFVPLSRPSMLPFWPAHYILHWPGEFSDHSVIKARTPRFLDLFPSWKRRFWHYWFSPVPWHLHDPMSAKPSTWSIAISATRRTIVPSVCWVAPVASTSRSQVRWEEGSLTSIVGSSTIRNHRGGASGGKDPASLHRDLRNKKKSFHSILFATWMFTMGT